MLTVEEEKTHALRVLASFITKLQSATDPFEVEAILYSIKRTAELACNRLHLQNRNAIIGKEQHVPAFISQTEYDARCSMTCVCGNAKEKSTLVCWDCFKRSDNALKWFPGTYEEWLKAREVKL